MVKFPVSLLELKFLKKGHFLKGIKVMIFLFVERVRHSLYEMIKTEKLFEHKAIDTQLKQLIHTSCRSEQALMLNEPNVTNPFCKTLTNILI